jgi:hypothetical protein
MIRWEQQKVMRGLLAELDSLQHHANHGGRPITDVEDDFDDLVDRFELIYPIWLDALAEKPDRDLQMLGENVLRKIEDVTDRIGRRFPVELPIIDRPRNRRAQQHG